MDDERGGNTKDNKGSGSHGDGHGPKQFNIQIDRVHFVVEKEEMTGLELRQLPPTPIGADRDLWLVVPGEADQKIGDDKVVEIKNGMRFFTAPAQINPGAKTR
jgi:hypothetical protein